MARLPSENESDAMTALTVGVIGIGAFGSRVALRLLWNDFPRCRSMTWPTRPRECSPTITAV